jgi:hypothetical protein
VTGSIPWNGFCPAYCRLTEAAGHHREKSCDRDKSFPIGPSAQGRRSFIAGGRDCLGSGHGDLFVSQFSYGVRLLFFFEKFPLGFARGIVNAWRQNNTCIYYVYVYNRSIINHTGIEMYANTGRNISQETVFYLPGKY